MQLPVVVPVVVPVPVPVLVLVLVLVLAPELGLGHWHRWARHHLQWRHRYMDVPSCVRDWWHTLRSLSWRLWSEPPTRDGALLGLVFVSTALSYTRFRVLTNKQTCRHNGDECAAIGIATKHFPLYGKFPGWDQHSYAYHSDDGNKFHGFGMVRHRRRAKCRNETNYSHKRVQPPKSQQNSTG